MNSVSSWRLLLFVVPLWLFFISKVSAEGGVDFQKDIHEPLSANPIENDLLNEVNLSGRGFYDRGNEVELARGKRDGDNLLYEFSPVANTILQSETQYYSFNVNSTTGLGEYYQFLIFITGNICLQPLEAALAQNNASLTAYFSFNSSMFDDFEIGTMAHFENGYFQALQEVPMKSPGSSDESILYIAVRAPENTNKSVEWLYQIGASQNDLVFQWDDRSWALLVDTDEDSALIVTGNLSSYDPGTMNITTMNVTELSSYQLYIYLYDYKDYFATYNRSWCAIRNGPSLLSSDHYETSYTTRSGGLQQQFYITGLNTSTTYIAYLVSDFRGSAFGGAVYQPFEFTTMENNACELIYDLDFCDKVAYSVPSSSNMKQDELKQAYDNRAEELYGNFSKALQQIPCDTISDAIFSPITSCKQCAASYKNWLCAITIPRCLTRNITGYKNRPVNDSRSEFINEEIVPPLDYYEVLPCVNVCHAIARDCPAQFGFRCPTKISQISKSYYWDIEGEYASCNYLGKTYVKSGALKLESTYLLLLPMILFYLI